MRSCPACGFETPDGASQCGRCHLAAGLFDAVREAVGVPETDPQYMEGVAEVLRAVGGSDAAPTERAGTLGRIARPARFLSLPSSVERTLPPGPGTIPQLPVLPHGDEVTALRRQIDELLQLGRRMGVELTDLNERAKASVLTGGRDDLEALHRNLFVVLAASLTDEVARVAAKRDEIAELVPTPSADVELEAGRTALANGDLVGAQRRLRHIADALSDLEDQWATVQILTAEAELLAETIRELGGDPGPALGPLDEGRRRARQGQRADAEPILARSTFALWSILSPLLTKDLARVKDRVLARREAGADVGPAVADLRELTVNLRHRNFGAAIGAYRRLRAFAEVPDRPPEAAVTPDGPVAP
ncbi:MAG: hypothetical protein ACREDK_05105 [Thermoplasmata archaeon]